MTDSSGSMSTRRQGLLGAHAPGGALVGGADQAVEDLGRLLEGAALEEAGEQEVAVLGGGQLVGDLVVVLDQQVAGLELDQRGRQEQELGRRVEVEGLGAGGDGRLGLGQERLDERRQAEPEHVELLAGDELGEQLEVALENGRLDLVRHGCRG